MNTDIVDRVGGGNSYMVNSHVFLEQRAREMRMKRRWNQFILIFFILTIVVARFPSFNQIINKGIAPLMAGAFLFQFRHLLRKMPAELYCFGGFLFWSLSGYPVALEKGYFLEYFTLIFQIFILMLVIVCHGKIQRNILTFHFVYMMNALVFFLTSLATKEVTSITGGFSSGRVFGLVVSPNGYGFIMFLAGVSALLWLSRKRKQRNARITVFISIVLIVATIGIIWSASRKAFIGWVVFASIWVMLNIGSNMARNIFAGVGIALTSLAIWFGVEYTLKETTIGIRFQKMEQEENVLGRNRTILYQESIAILRKHAIVGVGLSNFQVYSKLGGYTHSDYMEVLTNTGIPGFVLYLGFYVIIVKRILKTIPIALQRQDVINALNYLVFIAIYLMIGFGRPNFNSIFSMSYMAMISTESILLKESVRMQWRRRLSLMQHTGK
ncbi:O-antigen ligase family protein [bacterium]|nr:O-antigen ligase family protein [candidate division CSSED10-310 bacterium]